MRSAIIYRFLLVFLSVIPGLALAQSYDGQWQVSEAVNATACGEGNYTNSYTAVVVQTGNQLSVTANGINRSGTLSGNTLNFTASYPEDGGTTSSTGTIVFNGTSASGNSNWSWTNGSVTCAGTSSISGSKVSQPAPDPTPTPTPSPSTPGAPMMSFETSGNTLSVNWTSVPEATGYLFYYAPYPSADPVASLDVGAVLSIAGDLPIGTAFYIAIQAYNAAGLGGVSNVGNFLVKEVDVIEVANSSSDIAAIVFGKENASAVVFNGGSTRSTRFKFADNQAATLVSDAQGNPMQFDIAGYNFNFVYSGGQVRTTLTEPNGSQSSVVQSSLTSAIQSPEDYHLRCNDANICTDIQAASVDQDEAAALDQLIETEGGAMRRIAGSVLACPFWVPASACQALDSYLAQTENLVDRMTDQVNTKVKRVANKFNCLVDNNACADVVVAQAPAAVAELNQFDTAPSLPTAAFNVESDSLQPDPDTWATYLADAGFSMVDVPCAESVFRTIRPECSEGNGTPDTPDTTESPDTGSGNGSETPTEPIGNCVTDDTTRSTGEAGCFNQQGKRTGEWKFYFTDFNKKRFVGRTEVYSNNGTTAAITTYGDFGTYVIGRETQVDGKLDGDYFRYFSDGSPSEEFQYSAGLLHGSYKKWWEPGWIMREGSYTNGKEDGHWTFYWSPNTASSPGTKSSDGNYAAGKKVGLWTNYSSTNGAVTSTTTY